LIVYEWSKIDFQSNSMNISQEGGETYTLPL